MINKSDLYNLLRPKTIRDIIGQTHLLNDNNLISQMVNKKYLTSLIFYGNSGVGKSSLAIALCNDLKIDYDIFHSSIDSKEKLINLVSNAIDKKDQYVLIIDEIHRLNKDKQDILLPLIENNKLNVFLITTENPFFTIIPALRSRCQIIQLKPISVNEMNIGIKNINEKYFHLNLSNDAVEKISKYVNGDIRGAINILDLLLNLYNKESISIDILEKVLFQNYVLGYKDGDDLHNLKSAFHKSLRGSDVDASIYYLHRLINVGDFDAIYRRLTAMAYEDIGLANPNLINKVINAIESAKMLGMPEAKLPLTYIVIEMALSPKSNSVYKSISNVEQDVNNALYEIPIHIRDSHYKSASKLGIVGYKYPHDYYGSYVEQQYLPYELKDRKYYSPNNNESEIKIYNTYMSFIKNALKHNKD